VNPRTRILVGVALLALGGATVWLATTQAQADVRQVGDVLAHPAAYTHGRYTLVGVPQPESVPVTTPQGAALQPNPQWGNATRTTTSWTSGGKQYFSTHTLQVLPQPDGSLRWSFRNETRRTPADTQLAFPVVTAQWTQGQAGQAFPVEAFTSRPGGPARVWAWYDKATEHPLQPKPSQFRGHLMATLPDHSPAPDGLLVWIVEEYTAGCSSKFLPPEAQAKYNVTA